VWIMAVVVLAGCSEQPAGEMKSFPLSDVKLAEGSPFYRAQQADMHYMLAIDPDRLLAPYLTEAGLSPRKKGYGNWEGTGLNGHIGGHYLSALAFMYASAGNEELLERLNYMIDWLGKCQEEHGNGYVGGVPGSEALWEQIAAGNIQAEPFSLNGAWVPWYNLHKVFAGLRDAWEVTGIVKARDILTGLADWCYRLTENLTDEQMQDMLRCEHGGMNEVLADVYRITGDEKYLALARKFSHREILIPLMEGKDELTGKHANTQIPKVIGYRRIAELGNDTAWAQAAEFFWQTVVRNRTFVIGGNSNNEHFHAPGRFERVMHSTTGPETCNTYNMLRLTGMLYLAQPDARYMDFYERALYNHILTTQHPDGGFVYFTPLRPRHYRVYSRPDSCFWCCVGSGLENHGKYGEMIYAHNNKELYVNLFIPSTLHWKEKDLVLEQVTDFPLEDQTELRFSLKKDTRFVLYIRNPRWVRSGELAVQVNGEPVATEWLNSSWVAIDRNWKNNDVVSVYLPMHTYYETLPNTRNWIAFLHGPLVLASVTDTTDLEGLFAGSGRNDHMPSGPRYPLEETPTIAPVSPGFISEVKPVEGKPLTFRMPGLIEQEEYRNLELVPFYTVHEARYMIYWPVSRSSVMNELPARE